MNPMDFSIEWVSEKGRIEIEMNSPSSNFKSIHYFCLFFILRKILIKYA